MSRTGRKPSGGQKTVHIQARLHPEKRREDSALEVYSKLKGEGLDDRTIIREALIAYEIMTNDGWKPKGPDSTVKMTRDMQIALNTILDHINMLPNVVSNLGGIENRSEGISSGFDREALSESVSVFEQSIEAMFGHEYEFEDEE